MRMSMYDCSSECFIIPYYTILYYTILCYSVRFYSRCCLIGGSLSNVSVCVFYGCVTIAWIGCLCLYQCMIAYPIAFTFDFVTTPQWELISMFQNLSEGLYAYIKV